MVDCARLLKDDPAVREATARVQARCRELYSYLANNMDNLTNFGWRHRHGLPISSSRAEGCAAFERQFAHACPLVKVNPLQARRFAQSKGARAKTDAVDARMLAQMGAALDLAPQQPLTESMRDLKELQIARSALVKDQTRLSQPAANPDGQLRRDTK